MVEKILLLLTFLAPTPDVPPAPSLVDNWSKLVIDISEQRLYVYDSSELLVKTIPVSTGAPATPTPLGTYKVYSKSAKTFVRDNPSVTMNHMVRFNKNIGFHSIPRNNGVPMYTPLGKIPVSHGCVRLSDGNARELYNKTNNETKVIVRK